MSDTRTTRVPVYMTAAEKAEIAEAARREGRTVSNFMLVAALARARVQTGKE